MNADSKSRSRARSFLISLLLVGAVAIVVVLSSRHDVDIKERGAPNHVVSRGSIVKRASLRSSERVGFGMQIRTLEVSEPPVEVSRRLFAIPKGAVAVRFPDGESLHVEFRRIPPVRALDLSALPAPMTGDVDYAFTQFQVADLCFTSLRSGGVRDTKTACTQTADYYAAERDRWLQKAAEAGNVHAILKYSETSRSSFDALEDAWNAGYIPPLGRLAKLFSERALADDGKSNIRALAYLWLQAHLQDAAAGEGRRGYVASLYEGLHLKLAQLDQRDVEQAIQMAKELLRNNTHCCFGP
jgi:hypothetical protein